MQNDNDRPTTEAEETLRPPRGENVKDLVTLGADADAEAELDGAPDHGRANPKSGEAPEEEQSPT